MCPKAHIHKIKVEFFFFKFMYFNFLNIKFIVPLNVEFCTIRSIG
jgi:hypothetical protein